MLEARQTLLEVVNVEINQRLQALLAQDQLIARPFGPVIEVFEHPDVVGKLLISGALGSGKTITLLQLAATLISWAEANGAAQTPVIFELSGWKVDQQTFDQWLILQLKARYNLAEQISQCWLKTDQLLPLLDGLDELTMSDRTHCIEAINQFLCNYPLSRLVVCDRPPEINVRTSNIISFNRTVHLSPLTDAQIQTYLQSTGHLTRWHNWRRNPDLLALARSPLLLKIMVIANPGGAIKHCSDLFEAYINGQFEPGMSLPNKAPYTNQKTRQWLTWLARKLKAASQTELCLETIQPSWLDNPSQMRIYRLMIGLMGGLSFGLIVGLIGGLSFGLIRGLHDGLMGGLMGGLWGGLWGGLMIGIVGDMMDGLSFGPMVELDRIQPIAPFKVSWSAMRKRLVCKLIRKLTLGLLVGWLIGLTSNPNRWFAFGLLSGLTFGLLEGLLESLKAEISVIKIPNQGMRDSAKNFVIFSLITLPIGGLVYGLLSIAFGRIVTLRSIPLIGLPIGLYFGFFTGGIPCLQHLVLRLILWRSGATPWNYAKFLDYAANHGILLKLGGRYRFMHVLLQEHLINNKC